MEELRIGVFVCRCGSNIAGFLDVPAVVDYARTLPQVVFAKENPYSCSETGLAEIKEAIREHKLNRVVVASCTPRTHEPTFRAACKEAGVNPYLFEMANIRDQCSWVHMNEREEATRKANDLVRMAVAKAALLEPREPIVTQVNPRAMVIGGGIAGLTAATSLARRGFKVLLIEKEKELGGLLRHLNRLAPKRIEAVRAIQESIKVAQSHPNIEIHTSAQAVRARGYIGNYDIAISKDGTETEFKVGVIILATGAAVFKPEGLYGYDGQRVITQLELEQKLKQGKPGAGSVAMIQCVGARDTRRPYCSRICCMTAIKNATLIKEANPEATVVILYRDLQAYGVENEAALRHAKEIGVRFINYSPESPPVVEEGKVKVCHHLLGKELEIAADLVVLSTPLVAPPGIEELARMLRVSTDEQGFLLEAHVKLRPLDFATDGIYLCGSGHWPVDVRESISQALGASSRASIHLTRGQVEVEPIVSVLMDEDRCRGCGLCAALCPYGAIEIVKNEKGRKARFSDRRVLCTKSCTVRI